MDETALSLNDVMSHVATIGLDVFPPIEMKDERTRLNMFFEDARERWPDLYERLTTGELEFRVSRPFRKDPQVQGPTIPVDTFVLTPRGPVFVFPLRLPDPIGITGLESRFREVFTDVCKSLWARLPGHKIVRVGLLRDVIFSTGMTDCAFLMSKRSSWLEAKLVGGHRLIHYRDAKCNIQLKFSPVTIGKVTQLPVGAKFEQSVGSGLQVTLDVNNTQVRELQETDIDDILDRAGRFWPDELLEYLRGVDS